MMMVPIVLLVWLLSCCSFASRGDQDPAYQECLALCTERRHCQNPELVELPVRLRLFGWTCRSNCQYDCMWRVVEERRAKGFETLQYHGKWPFARLGGFQEAASVIFSAANGIAHWKGYMGYCRVLGKRANARVWWLHSHYTLYLMASLVAWASAVLFHTRDVWWTERADYFSAMTSIFFGLHMAIIRHCQFIGSGAQLLTAIPLVGLLLYHLYYMNMVSFDYGWNMILLGTCFGIFGLIWLVWGIRNFHRQPHAKLAIVWVLGACAASSLELLDFHPWWDLVDAHALWHAATVPLVLLLWRIYTIDAMECIRNPPSRSLAKESHMFL
jgi:hypothetical protein